MFVECQSCFYLFPTFSKYILSHSIRYIFAVSKNAEVIGLTKLQRMVFLLYTNIQSSTEYLTENWSQIWVLFNSHKIIIEHFQSKITTTGILFSPHKLNSLPYTKSYLIWWFEHFSHFQDCVPPHFVCLQKWQQKKFTYPVVVFAAEVTETPWPPVRSAVPIYHDISIPSKRKWSTQ